MNHKQEIGIGVFFLIFASVYIGFSFQIQSFDPFGNDILGSRAIPQVFGAGVILLSLIHIGSSVLKLRQEQKETAKEGGAAADKESKEIFGRPFRLMVITILLISAYIFFYTRLGFVVSTALFLLAEIFILIPNEKRKKWAVFIVCFSLGMAAFLFTLFTRVLSIFLPFGLLWW
ncbi:MAG: tripartite tricarboxylate transporter TctB family protein [Spirochaetes bacterium]|nr:tripartite tricarboxylate transporter TctB family protein [Spirochaetota bacterium]